MYVDQCQKLYQLNPHLKIVISIIIGKRMKMFCFKFQQNRTINEEFDIFEGEGQWDHHLSILISNVIGRHMKMFCFKFQQNRTVNEEF